MDQKRLIITILHDATHPMSWYNIATVLSAKGIVDVDLPNQLAEMLAQGYIVNEEMPRYPHGVYCVTEKGEAYLAESSGKSE